MKLNQRMFNHTTKQAGMTLVELMVAMTLSLVILAGVIQVFIANKQTYRMNDALSRVQENGRFAINFLVKDIRMAGFQGCGITGDLTSTLKQDCAGPSYCLEDNFDVGIEGYDNVSATTPSYLSDAGIVPIADTDVVILRRSVDSGISVEKNNSSAQVFVSSTSFEAGGCSDGTDKISGLCEGDVLLVSDCSKSRVFQAANLTETSAASCGSASGADCLNITHPASGTPGNDPSSWGGAAAPEDEQFSTDASIYKMETIAFYIANGTSGEPALFIKQGTNASQELVEGIDNMQILYGEDTGTLDMVANIYRTATDVVDWGNVVSVRISLLSKTIENNIASEEINYFYNGSNNTPTSGDKRLRRVFTTTINVRNRSL